MARRPDQSRREASRHTHFTTKELGILYTLNYNNTTKRKAREHSRRMRLILDHSAFACSKQKSSFYFILFMTGVIPITQDDDGLTQTEWARGFVKVILLLCCCVRVPTGILPFSWNISKKLKHFFFPFENKPNPFHPLRWNFRDIWRFGSGRFVIRTEPFFSRSTGGNNRRHTNYYRVWGGACRAEDCLSVCLPFFSYDSVGGWRR